MASQRRPPDVLIICDDGSTDGTLEHATAAARGASFQVVPHAGRNVGWIANCERGLRAVDTELVAFCDQDDVWLPNKLELEVRALEADARVELVFANATVADESLTPLGPTLRAHELRALRSNGVLASLLRYNLAQNATIVGRTAALRALMPTPPSMTFDAWLALGIAARGRVAVVEEPVLLYRQHAANQLGSTRGLRRWAALASSLLRTDDREHRGEQLERYRNARARLVAMGVTPAVASELDAKVAHLEWRASLADARVRRALPVARELMSARYQRYGRGWRGALRDLVAKRTRASS